MDFNEYRVQGKEMVDFIADYLQNIRDRPVFPNVTPGYMRLLVPDSAPDDAERWQDIYKDIERVIMPGVTHWQSPHMHAYFPALNSFPSMLGDMLADAIGCLGFTWASSPACTELEIIVMDWLGKMIGLPSEFFHSNTETMGGGVIQTTASEATFVSLLAARSETIKKFRAIDSELTDSELNARLVGYCSDQAHSSVEKAGLIGLVKMRLLSSDDQLSLRGETLRQAIETDRANGLIPFYVCATLGTTGACAFDNLKELGPICVDEDLWMHIDAAYAGSAFVCDEFRCFMDGVDAAQSFAFNPSKWLMVHFDCTAMWVKDSRALHRTFNVQPIYLLHENTGTAIDFMHWQVPLSKRFRALKLWFVIRSFGVKGLQNHIRKGVKLAEGFESLVKADDRFEVAAKRHLGMVVFRLKGDNERTELLLRRLNASGKVHMVPASLKGRYVIRFTVTSQFTRPEDILRDWNIIQRTATDVLQHLIEAAAAADAAAATEEEEEAVVPVTKTEESLRHKRERLRRKDYSGLSLILSNVPMSPKFINGSFAALFDSVANDCVSSAAAEDDAASSFSFAEGSVLRFFCNGSPIAASPRRRLDDGRRQCSFDHALLPVANGGGGGGRGAAGVPPLNPSSLGMEAAAGESAGRGRGGRQGNLKQGSLDSKIDEILLQKPTLMPDIKDDESDGDGTVEEAKHGAGKIKPGGEGGGGETGGGSGKPVGYDGDGVRAEGKGKGRRW